MFRFKRRLACLPFLAVVICMAVAGCRSPHIEVTVINSGSTVLHNIEVDYPSASFGIPALAPGQKYPFKIRLQDSGRFKVQFFDSAEKQHSGTGPYAAERQRGTLFLLLDGDGKNVWTANLQPSIAAPKE